MNRLPKKHLKKVGGKTTTGALSIQTDSSKTFNGVFEKFLLSASAESLEGMQDGGPRQTELLEVWIKICGALWRGSSRVVSGCHYYSHLFATEVGARRSCARPQALSRTHSQVRTPTGGKAHVFAKYLPRAFIPPRTHAQRWEIDHDAAVVELRKHVPTGDVFTLVMPVRLRKDQAARNITIIARDPEEKDGVPSLHIGMDVSSLVGSRSGANVAHVCDVMQCEAPLPTASVNHHILLRDCLLSRLFGEHPPAHRFQHLLPSCRHKRRFLSCVRAGFAEELRVCQACGATGGLDDKRLKKCPCMLDLWHCSTTCQKNDVCFFFLFACRT